MEKGVRDAQKRYQEISDIVEGDETGEKFVSGLVRSVNRYVGSVSEMQAFFRSNSSDSRSQGNGYEAEKYQERVKELDNLRRSSHEGLISRLHMVNRYLFNQYPEETPRGGIYSLSPNSITDRKAIGEWAGYLYKAISTTNKPSEQKNE